MTDFGKKIRPALSTIIFGTKWERGNPFFLQKEGGQWD